MNGAMWSIATVVGPILLIAALVWGYFRTRKGSRSEIARAEEGAVQLREDIRRDPEYRSE